MTVFFTVRLVDSLDKSRAPRAIAQANRRASPIITAPADKFFDLKAKNFTLVLGYGPTTADGV